MNEELAHIPAARSWRDIPQPVKPRAMSREGRWRLFMAGVRTAAVGVGLGVLAWGTWLFVAALRENSRAMPAAAKNVSIQPPELITSTGGVLDSEWLARTLALPAKVSLMELDLDRLRERVLGDGQVLTATLTRNFPDKLVVKVTERTPVARIKVQFGEEPRELLVAPDGVVFSGHGFERILLDTLPWLSGMSLARDGAWFRPIAGMHVVSEMLAQAQEDAPHVYRQWHIVSVDRMHLDHEVDVITKTGTTVVFDVRASYLKQPDARTSFLRQFGWLDYILEKLEHTPAQRARIDLSLGREVPVMIETAKMRGGVDRLAQPGAAPGTPLFTLSHAKKP